MPWTLVLCSGHEIAMKKRRQHYIWHHYLDNVPKIVALPHVGVEKDGLL